MAILRHYKTTLKAASLAYLAGAHAVTNIVWMQKSEGSAAKKRPQFLKLKKQLKALAGSRESVENLIDFLNEETIFPFQDEWPAEGLKTLISLLKGPELSFEDPTESKLTFRFKKGFHKTLGSEARKGYSVSAGTTQEPDHDDELDHWLLPLLNGAFHTGAIAAARNAYENTAFYTALSSLEQEGEPWARYPQLGRLFENEVHRVKNRLEEHDDPYGDEDDGEEDLFGYDDDDGYGDS